MPHSPSQLRQVADRCRELYNENSNLWNKTALLELAEKFEREALKFDEQDGESL